MSEKSPEQTTQEWWAEWKKPDGSSCTKMEMLRAFAQMRRRNRAIAKILDPETWLSLHDDKAT